MYVQTLTSVGFKYLTDKLGKMNKRAEKNGLDTIGLEVVKTYTRVENNGEDEELVTYIDFIIEGEKPTIKGYKMVAVLEKEISTNIINFVLGENEEDHNIEEYREKTDCDHCKHNRKRKHTYILQDDNGDYIQVGRTCLKDFLEADISYWVKIAELDLGSIERDAVGYFGGSIPLAVDIESFIAMTLEYVKEEGYFGSNSTITTGSKVWDNFHNAIKKYVIKDVVEKNREDAREVVEWAKKQEESKNTYLRNLSVIAKEGLVTWKRIGFAASMVVAKSKEEGTYERKEKKEVVDSKYVGEIGKREMFRLNVDKIFTFGSRFGDVDMILFKDSEGNVFKWSTTSMHGFEEGDDIEVMGTVKKHLEYRGVKQTEINRVKEVK